MGKMGDLLSQSAQDSSRLRNELETSQQLTQRLLENSRLKEEIEWLHSRISKLENEKQSDTNRIHELVATIRNLKTRDVESSPVWSQTDGQFGRHPISPRRPGFLINPLPPAAISL